MPKSCSGMPRKLTWPAAQFGHVGLHVSVSMSSCSTSAERSQCSHATRRELVRPMPRRFTFPRACSRKPTNTDVGLPSCRTFSAPPRGIFVHSRLSMSAEVDKKDRPSALCSTAQRPSQVARCALPAGVQTCAFALRCELLMAG